MNILLFNKILIGLIVFPATLMALLTKLPSNKIMPPFFSVKNPDWTRWHRRAGWITLAGLVLQRWIYLLAKEPPIYPLKPEVFAHGVLITLCAVAVLYKVWSAQRTAGRRLKQKILWWATITAFGAGFAVLTYALLIWRWVNPPITWGYNMWLIYWAGLLGHIGLALALIGLGRLGLANRHSSSQQDIFARSGGMGWTDPSKTGQH
jgi:hypothetical protein